MAAKELLKEGKLDEALTALSNEVRATPNDAKLRVFLFQLLAVMGQWQRALNQLNVAADLDPSTLLMAQVCRPAIGAEALRAEIFAGKRSPLIFGEPEEWIGWLVEANKLLAQGHHAAAAELRDKAFEAAPATSGTINGQAFEWIADGDPRFGPVFELMMDGKYYWVPAHRIAMIEMEAPSDLRDLVWQPATFTWSTGAKAIGLVPVRYPGTETAGDNLCKLARKTDWTEQPGWNLGVGQRMVATDAAELPLLEIRNITLNTGAPASATEAEPAADAT